MSVRIDADLLIPGRGEPLRSGSVVMDGARISYVGPTATAPPADVRHTGPVVMPGMWDCHAHFAGLDTPNLDALHGLDPRLAVLRAAQDVETALISGFTSIREVGGHGVWLARAISEGRLAGPTIYGAGAVLSQTAGHADMHSLPLEVVASLAARHLGIVCDGPDDCRKAVRQDEGLPAPHSGQTAARPAPLMKAPRPDARPGAQCRPRLARAFGPRMSGTARPRRPGLTSRLTEDEWRAPNGPE